MLPDYPIERFQVSDRLQFGVNLSNGNLWIDHRDLTIRGTGIDLTLRHSYGYDDEWYINAAAGTNPFRCVGGYTLKGGLTLFGHRYYNSSWGRFTAPDPTQQERNLYAYAQSDPINNTDPTGAYSVDDFKSDMGTIADTVAVVGVAGGIGGCALTVAAGCLAGAASGAFYGGVVGLGLGIGIVIFG
ncbi:RHS repeat-associated core domain-containing protein [Lentzea fradiae]|uniref:RHS repeat-associated core domain-containing protein n=1 Tax=Lentzea fradiae TaxID=200378 RepID=A0A1G7XQU8_9PSEU|nr:RHS repeat-associated core domain-containing protein [Lentzea fradiae]